MDNAFTFLQETMNAVVGSNKVSALSSVESFVTLLANVFIVVAFGLSIASIAFSFVQFITSTGDPKMVEKAQRGALWGVIGVILSILAYTLKNILVSSAGITGLK